MQISLDMLENEQLIGKLKLLEMQNSITAFKNANENSVERRFSQALMKIPAEYHEAAIAIFGSVVYFTEDMLTDSWKFLWQCVQRNYPCQLADILLLELDRDLIRDDFYHACKLTGRLDDNHPWRSTHDIIDAVINITTGTSTDYRDGFVKIKNRKYWILLIDISISGSSAVSEMERTHKMIDLLYEGEKPKVIALFQVVTDEAIEKLDASGFEYFYAIRVPLSCAFGSPSYNLIKSAELKNNALELFDWFAAEFVLGSSTRIADLAKADPDIAKFGYGKMGWNIVTYRNTPNNSLPILWFRRGKDDTKYLPPFVRIDSRNNTSAWEGRRAFVKKIEQDEVYKKEVISALKQLLNEN